MVEDILDKRIITENGHSQTQYLVKWTGYPLDEASWVSTLNLRAKEVRKMVAAFNKKNPQPRSS